MTQSTLMDAYERVVLASGTTSAVFLYVLHFSEANYLQLGAGAESRTGLQRAHMGGPQVHKAHLSALIDWMKGSARINLLEQPAERVHPLSSNYTVDLEKRLATTDVLSLSIGRYLPLIRSPEVGSDQVRRFADAIERVRVKAFGHPLDWQVRHVELNDGRFVWLAYDHDLKKIRIGMGFHNEANEKQYGKHTYAIGQREAGSYVSHHYVNPDLPIPFSGLPPRFPMTLGTYLFGDLKKTYAAELLRLSDEVWPDGVEV